MTLLAYSPNEWHASAKIAGSLNINPVLVRKELKALKEGNLIESKEGKNGGVRLMKSANDIRISDIFSSAKGSSHVLNLSSNLPEATCVIGGQINEKLLDMFIDIDNAIISALQNQTLEEFKNQF
jgi:DNA-binding IscR family transcriptional regulator